ncbi:MAG: hypothetical protein HZA37_00840 [Parcubacteria group bacterium]|nr:hypothetical protein [Parcubacteria group bacterium]
MKEKKRPREISRGRILFRLFNSDKQPVQSDFNVALPYESECVLRSHLVDDIQVVNSSASAAILAALATPPTLAALPNNAAAHVGNDPIDRLHAITSSLFGLIYFSISALHRHHRQPLGGGGDVLIHEDNPRLVRLGTRAVLPALPTLLRIGGGENPLQHPLDFLVETFPDLVFLRHLNHLLSFLFSNDLIAIN